MSSGSTRKRFPPSTNRSIRNDKVDNILLKTTVFIMVIGHMMNNNYMILSINKPSLNNRVGMTRRVTISMRWKIGPIACMHCLVEQDSDREALNPPGPRMRANGGAPPLHLASRAGHCRVGATRTSLRGSPRYDVASNRARKQWPTREGGPKGQGAGVSFFSSLFLDKQEKGLARAGQAHRSPEDQSARDANPPGHARGPLSAVAKPA